MTREKALETVLVICLGLLVIYAITGIRELLYGALAVGFCSVFIDWIAFKISWLWMKLAEAMGFVMSKVVLSIVFYLFLYPISVLQRLFSKSNSLQLKKTEGDSYFVTRNHEYKPKDFDNIW